MKTSKYNIFFPFEGKMIGYNSISDNFVILEPILHELFEASARENIVEELQDVHENLFDILVSNGFIIEDNIDELELIKTISYETDFNEETYELTINPTMNCNFKCWYCYETHIKDSKMSKDTLVKVASFIGNILEEKKGRLKNFKLSWFGGEPLLYFDKTVLPILKEVYPKMLQNKVNFMSVFTTNGLLIDQELLNECRNYGVNSFQITLDGHRERHNQVRFISANRGSYNEIVDNIKLCLKNEFYVNVRINISVETTKDLLSIIDDFKDLSYHDKKYLIFSFHEVWQEEKDLTADISHIVDKFRQNNLKSTYKGEQTASIQHSCYADKLNHATINYNGDVFKCTARDFETSSREGVLEDSGHIVWNEKFQKRIYDTRFQNKPCLECKILPICNGGCSQHRMENENQEYCIHDFDEGKKLDIIKEKFYSRIALKAPSNHFNETINSLLNINFREFKEYKTEVFQETLSGFFLAEVRERNLSEIQKANDLYASALLELRKNLVSNYHNIIGQVNDILDELNLTAEEEKVASLFALPVIAYFKYKLGNYDEAIQATNESILNDDYFLQKHPFLYGHKIQQLHNTMRVLFKAQRIDDAYRLGLDTLGHLIFGNKINHNIGKWYNSYSIEDNKEMVGMVYQIFTETVKTITQIAHRPEVEREYFEMAFFPLLSNKGEVATEIRPLIDFIKVKKSLFGTKQFNDVELQQLIDDLSKSDFAYMCYPLYKSLFTTVGINSYKENKEEFDRVYA